MSSDIFSIDPLQLYMGYDYKINDNIIIHQPKMRDITSVGEQEYFSMVYTICANPTDMKVKLWDIGIDWCEIDDFDLFMMLTQSMTQERTKLLFGDLDLSKMKQYRSKENGEILLANPETQVKIDKLVYMRIVEYVRKMHKIKPTPTKHAKNQYTKQAMLDYARQQEQLRAKEGYKSYLVPTISALQCRMGWTKDYILDMGIVEYFEVVSRTQIINEADHLLSGVYAGTVDLKKVKNGNEKLNWMREIE